MDVTMSNFSVPTHDELLARFSSWDYVALAVMLLSSATLGVYCAFSGGPQNTIRQLLIGSGTLPVVPVSTSLMASFISAAYILGNAAEVYQYGTMIFMTSLSYCAMIPTTMLFYLPVYYELGVTTSFEYLELRFGRTTRVCAVILYVIQMLIYVSISLYAPALAMSQLTGMNLWIAVSAMGVVCTIYTSLGGIKAVVYTDTFQSFFMLGALAAVIVSATIRLEGGLSTAWRISKRGQRIDFGSARRSALTDDHSLWSLFLGSYVTNLASYATNQMMIVRYMTVDTIGKAHWMVFLNLPYLVLTLLMSCVCGMLVYARYAACDPVTTGQVSSVDQMLPYFVMDALGDLTPLPGIFVAGVFAASLSSVSSGVNALASVFYVDVIALARDGIPDRIGAKIINLLGVVFGLSSIGLVAVTKQLGNVLDATQSINSAIGGPLLGVFTAGMLFPQINSTGALWGLVTSLLISLWINLGSILAGPTASGLPVRVDGCASPLNTTALAPVIDPQDVLWMYQISSAWYSLISFVIVFLVSMLVSLVTGSVDSTQLDPRLIRHPADIFLWWLNEESRQRWRFDVGENYEEGEVFEPRKSVTSFGGYRPSMSGPNARKPSFSDLQMMRRRSSVFMSQYPPPQAAPPQPLADSRGGNGVGSCGGQQRLATSRRKGGSLADSATFAVGRRAGTAAARAARYSFESSAKSSHARKPSFTESEMMRRRSSVFMTQYLHDNTPTTGMPALATATPMAMATPAMNAVHRRSALLAEVEAASSPEPTAAALWTSANGHASLNRGFTDDAEVTTNTDAPTTTTITRDDDSEVHEERF